MRERSFVLHGAGRAAGERYFVLQKHRSVSHQDSARSRSIPRSTASIR